MPEASESKKMGDLSTIVYLRKAVILEKRERTCQVQG